MAKLYQRLSAAFAAKAKRERLLMAGLGILVIAGVTDFVAFTPAASRVKAAREQARVVDKLSHEIQQQERDLDAQVPTGMEQQAARLRSSVDALQAEVVSLQQSLLPPTQVHQFMKDLVPKGGSLVLVGFANLDVVDLARAPSADTKANAATPSPAASQAAAQARAQGINSFYQHNFRVDLNGGYLELLAYLNRLQDSKWRTLVTRTNITVGKPSPSDQRGVTRASMTIYLSTFSSEPAWIRLGQ